MSDTMVDQVRRFNRVVTERVGALNDRFLGRGRPLGEARLLWEIGPDGCEVRLLRSRLDLDSGYVSRLLRSLESAGLIELNASAADRRIRVARLTTAGRRERATLDRRSDKLAQSLLAPLSSEQRQRLVAAMRDVERLLVAASVEIRPVDPEDPDAQYCLAEYVAELNRRSTRGFDPSVGATARPDEVRPPAGQFFVGYLHGNAIGCGAVKHHADAPAEIKRMWIAPEARGLGLGRRLLETLEACALARGAPVAHIETSAVLTEALALYRSTGWIEVAAFNDEPFADHWFEKALTDQTRRTQRPRVRNRAGLRTRAA
jgi:DNA-binding MarR family transcriptional regulator/N-acetylglutamate synthase-like GNAT family acetyltransferase